ncbi:MAG: hypothetical protein L0323_00705 [Planctomycetes bacterium]|nr:hypothetical protein [Planctomycetota bacterium]
MKAFLGNRIGLALALAALAGAMAPSTSAQSGESRPAAWQEALRAADRMLAQGKYAEAKAAYDTLAAEPTPVEPMLRYKRAFAAAKTGDLASAGADYSAVAAGGAGRLAGSALLRRAEVAQRAGDDPAVAEAFTRIGQVHVDHPQSSIALTRILAHIGKAKSAGKRVPPGLVQAAEVLASRGPRSRWRPQAPITAPKPPTTPPAPPAKAPAKKPVPPPAGTRPKPGQPPSKDPTKGRVRPAVPQGSGND